MTNCQKCGARVDADDEFCPECGAKIRQPTEALPAREAQKIVMMQAQPKKHRFLTVVIIIIVLILFFRACASFASEPQLPSKTYQPEYVQEVPADERLISIETPPPRINPIPEPNPLPNKDAECSGVVAKIIDVCESSGWSVYDYFTVENTGSKPILAFNARYYTNAMSKDETRLFEPLDVGASYEYYSYYGGIKMIEVVPIIVVNGEEIVCDKNVASYGNAYGEGFESCSSGGDYGGTPVGAEPTTYGGYDATYDVGYS